MSKREADDWETVTTYVATYPTDYEDGACDVEVQVGEDDDGVWYIRTRDDAGGSDDAPDTAYDSRDDAVSAAEEFAEANDEGDGEGDDAEDYLRGQLEARAGEPSEDGEWCVYWWTVGDDEHVVARYDTRDAAEAATQIANEGLHAAHPGSLLCGYEVRSLVDGEWVGADDE